MARRAGPLPAMVVFDLDACLWTPEMFQLPCKPSQPVRGPLLDAGEGCVALQCVKGKKCGPRVTLFPGALAALQEMLTQEEWKGTKIAAASSSLEPSYSFECLKALEALPGVPLESVFHHVAIGRTGELSSDKKTHFTVLHRESGVRFEDMLFFDDCIWGDNVGRVQSLFGVVGVRTPHGITKELWEEGLRIFATR